MASLGTKLRLLRERKRFTQLKVAELLGIGNKTLSDYERDVTEPDLETLKKMANLYGVSLDYLAGNFDNKNIENEDDDFKFALYDMTKDLTEEQKQDILKVVNIIKKQ